jgi:carbon-monoxide dehydrogenase medium subunit
VASSSAVQKSIPALSDAASMIGDVQVRNRGTIGGSVVHSDPGADMPAVLVALGAQIIAKGNGGERSIDAENCFTGTFTTSIKSGELVTQVTIPAPAAGSGNAYAKHPDAASGYAVVGVAASVTVSGGNITAARVAMTGLAEKATRLTAVESALVGKAATAATADAAAKAASTGVELFDDARGTAAYKANLAQVYAARAIKAALARAGA